MRKCQEKILQKAYKNNFSDKKISLLSNENYPVKFLSYLYNILVYATFEWIKNRKRIIKEGTDMHHCVASYAEKINKDKCAIYSFVYKDKKRYTIEFIYTKNNRYSIRQIQGMCDRGRPEEVSEYVN